MKKKLIALTLGVGLLCTSCLGPNKAFNEVHDWNEGVSENRWVKELVFLGCTIIPVYSFAYALDILVFNSIEWWSGSNPIDD